MLILGLDTSSATASLALVEINDMSAARTLGVREAGSNQHAEELVPLLDALLRAHDKHTTSIDAIAIGAGPGSFTGLRIGMATAKGLAFALERPLWAVSSLAAYALEVASTVGATRIAALLDARRSEVFLGCFEVNEGQVRAIDEERVLPPEEVAAAIRAAWPGVGASAIAIAGEGLVLYREGLGDLSSVGATHAPSARLGATPTGVGVAMLAASGDRVDAVQGAVPAYIRPAEAEIKFPKGSPGGTFSPGS